MSMSSGASSSASVHCDPSEEDMVFGSKALSYSRSKKASKKSCRIGSTDDLSAEGLLRGSVIVKIDSILSLLLLRFQTLAINFVATPVFHESKAPWTF